MDVQLAEPAFFFLLAKFRQNAILKNRKWIDSGGFLILIMQSFLLFFFFFGISWGRWPDHHPQRTQPNSATGQRGKYNSFGTLLYFGIKLEPRVQNMVIATYFFPKYGDSGPISFQKSALYELQPPPLPPLFVPKWWEFATNKMLVGREKTNLQCIAINIQG